ncbi:hypothetical protein R6Q59_018915 [Mikania micrantha]
MEQRVAKIKMIFGFLVVLHASITCTYASNTLSANQIVRYNETIVSPQETFELGFFSPGNSLNHYVGIWYKKLSKRTYVWVANRNTPLADTSSELTLTRRGVLVIRNTTTGYVIWSSTNLSTTSVRNPTSQLLDSGNFIIYEDGNINQENPIWQSFDFLTDTLLPGMKHGWNLVTRTERYYTSWKSSDDPAPGDFSMRVDTRGYPQIFLMNREEVKFRAGPWNGLRFSGDPDLKPNPIYNFTFVINEKEIYYQYSLVNRSVFSRLVLQPSGDIQRMLWVDSIQNWQLYLAPESDHCDQYAVCKAFGSCNIDNSPVCECLKGFEPASPEKWAIADWTQGCRRTIPLDCGPGEGFNKYTNMKLPDTRGSWYNQTMTLVECEKKCKSNCSCIAYTNSNVSGTGSGCLLWFGDLIDIRTFAETGDTLYIRMPYSELDSISSSAGKRRRIRVVAIVASVILVILISICLFYSFKRKKQQQERTPANEFQHDPENSISTGDEDLELPLFGLSALYKATNNFSMNNKLGEGGFGPVYKGVLEDGHEIAVKRLAKTSTQGLYEFKNEVISISKLQHRNLVKLLGCCIEGAEKMLVYEYLPNKGLDSFIFDKSRKKLLDWPARYNIITGIARGLLYLHQDSRLRIIHRDLKLSNILLDKDMNPKISDFGMARTFGGNQIEANTNRVVGTYGYMAPEYAGDGIFSIKSDVYSFGVLVLEIVCGEKNRGFVHKEHCNNLVGHAWVLHNEEKSLQLVEKCLSESIDVSQVLRSIHVGLLCVQRHPEDRPTMTSVILMLGSEGPLPSPKEPGFYVGKTKQDITESSSSYGISSNNDLSITMLNVMMRVKLIFGILILISFTHAADIIISPNQIVTYNQTIVSSQETFELGFFSPRNSVNHYVGIWYKKISTRTIVWVANRNTPLTDASVELTLTVQGVLTIRNTTTGIVIWSSTNSSTTSVKNPVGQLLDTGNFIIYEQGNQEDPIWQSFDFMTDTLLPGMKQGWNLITGTENHFTSWKSDDDPASGEFSYGVDARGYPQLIQTKGQEIMYRVGPWNGLRFSGVSNLRPNRFYNFTFVVNKKESYYQYYLLDTSVIMRLVLQPSGTLERLLWMDSKQEWSLYLLRQNDLCDKYAQCGPFGKCNIDESPICECLKGFEPVSPDQWKITDWSQGCRRTIPLECDPSEGFNKYSNLKLPDTRGSWHNHTMTLVECEKMCKSNCSCTAYTNSNISGSGSGCLLWFGSLIDIKMVDENGDNLYVRMPYSELDSTRSSRAPRRVRVIVPAAFVVLVILVSIYIFCRFNTRKQLQEVKPGNKFGHVPETGSADKEIELPLFGLSTILKATNNFSMNNKLGEGGFGPVYKGVLKDGKEIAVKRLAKTSTQGLHEFTNEITSISKLQHRNLVKLMGCCIERKEVMLIYEYMPNKGLDSFIFDKTQSKLLDWHARYHIIIGIARGLLYLHQDSRLRIIHRDLKVSNILLDKDMNPKISDFGTARTFGGNQIEAKTKKVVGTYGYMAPEYAGGGIFSIKSDIYSFGVLVLEIVCGEKNRGFVHKENCNNLIGHAWELHNKGRPLQLVAKCLGESVNVTQVLRSIHVGLLCVQRHPQDRPTMTSIIMMLESEGPLPSPKEPAFYVGESKLDTTLSLSSDEISSKNELSITMLNGR